MTVAAIILAAGRGERFGTDKQFISLNGKPMAQHSIDTFRSCPSVDRIIVVVNNIEKAKGILKGADLFVEGGPRRQDSAYNGLLACDPDTRFVLIHDAARPFVTKEMIERLLEVLRSGRKGATVGWPVVDTTSITDSESNVISIPERKFLWRHQTPQGFDYKELVKAYRKVPEDQTFTDDISIFKYAGNECYIIPGEEINIKITTPADLFIAERISQWRSIKIDEPDLSGKNILVFGGTGGIGAEVVKNLIQRGAEVTALSSKEADLRKDFLPRWLYDVSWDVIVHCAGVLRKNAIDLSSISEFDELFRINTRSLILVCDLAVKTMKEGGNIVVVGSSSAWKGRKGYTYYSATKAALCNLVEGLAEELMPYGIRINCVNPSRTLTESIREFYPNDPEDAFLDPAYVARVIVSLCGTEETGQIINIRNKMANFMEEYAGISSE